MLLKYKYHFLLFLVVMLCYWPLTFFQTTLLHDDIDVALTTKYFAGSCLQQGFLPLWNPYQIFGFPAHADLQYVNWNIETLIIGTLFGYNYITLHILFLFYLFIGALGMYMLGMQLNNNNKIAFYIAIIYMLSGLIASHVQSLVTILGIVWMPYVILYFIRWLNKPNIKSTSLLSIFFYLFFTLGYQAFAFMLIPILSCILIVETIKNIRAKNKLIIKQHIIWSIVSILFVIILFMPIIVTQLQTMPFVARLGGMTVEEVMSNPFSPYGLISLINPILTIGNDALFNADITMRNVYIGLIPLVLLITSFFKKNKTSLDYILLSFSILYLFASFGDILPVRKILYYFLPGFKLFRFPSLIKVLVVISLLIYLSINFKATITLLLKDKKIKWISIGIVLISSLSVLIFTFSKIHTFSFFSTTELSFNNRVKNTSSYEIAFYLSLIQTILFTLFIISIIKVKNNNKFINQTIAISIAEFAITISLYGQYLSFTEVKPSYFQSNFNKIQTNFPFPSSDPINDNDYKFNYISGFWKNTGAFKKQLSSHDEWTSFLFKNYNNITDNYTTLKDTLTSYPFIYFSKPNKTEYSIKKNIDTSQFFFNNTFHFKNENVDLNYIKYLPHSIIVECLSTKNVILNLQQSYFCGWQVKIDGQNNPLLWNASLLMSVALSAGKHVVEFKYANPIFEYSLLFSYCFLILLIIVIIFNSNKSQKSKILIITVFLIVCTTILLKYLYNKITINQQTQNTFVFNDKENTTLNLNFTNKIDVKTFINALDKYDPQTINYKWKNFYNSPEILALIITPTEKLNEFEPSLNGEILYKKSKYKSIILISQEYNSHFKNKQFIDSLDNNFTLVLNSKINPYSYNVNLSKKIPASKSIFGFVTLRSSSDAKPIVVCSIKHYDGKEDVLYFDLNKYLIANADFQKIPFYLTTNDKITESDDVNFFIMNQNNGNVYIKDFVIKYNP